MAKADVQRLRALGDWLDENHVFDGTAGTLVRELAEELSVLRGSIADLKATNRRRGVMIESMTRAINDRDKTPEDLRDSRPKSE